MAMAKMKFQPFMVAQNIKNIKNSELFSCVIVCTAYRPSAIQQQELSVPSLEDPKVVIKTNPLYSGFPSQHLSGKQAIDCSENVGSQPNREVFYGQRRNIRKTKEQEMINAIVGLTNHSESENA
jgi:hypothetical protein